MSDEFEKQARRDALNFGKNGMKDFKSSKSMIENEKANKRKAKQEAKAQKKWERQRQYREAS